MNYINTLKYNNFSFGCATAALINIFSWLGDLSKKNDSKEIEKIKRIIGEKQYKTKAINFHKGLNKFKKDFSFFYENKPKFDDLIKHLNEGGSIVLLYFDNPNSQVGHFTFLRKENGKLYNNDELIYPLFIKRLLNKSFQHQLKPEAWFINS